MKVYCAAPMRGYPQYNHPAINAAVARLREAGHEVFSPAEQDALHGQDPSGTDGGSGYGHDPAFLRTVLREDLSWILRNADVVVVLPGWDRSKGCMAEAQAAFATGIPVRELEGFLQDHGTGDVRWSWIVDSPRSLARQISDAAWQGASSGSRERSEEPPGGNDPDTQ